MEPTTQYILAGLVFLLILLIILLFSQTPFLSLFHETNEWSKLDENSGILDKLTNVSQIPLQYSTPTEQNNNLSYNNPLDGFIRMGYGIQEENEPKKYLVPSEEIEHQLLVDAVPDIHTSSIRKEPEQGVLRRALSTDSVDSSASSLLEMNRDVPTTRLILNFDEATQMFSVQVQNLSDIFLDYGQIWMLFFLLPHPKPLWRTEAQVTPSSLIKYNCIFQQCVRKCDLNRIALLVQLYSSRNQSASIVGQARIRLKDISLTSGEDISVDLAMQPNKTRVSLDEISQEKLGEILFLTTFSHDRLTIIVSRIRNLSHHQTSVFVRLYIVQLMGKVTKKKTAVKAVVEGAADIGESMFFTISRNRVLKSHIRLSVVCSGTGETYQSIGHVTLGPKTSGKEFGHWKRALQSENPPLASWHSIQPRSTV